MYEANQREDLKKINYVLNRKIPSLKALNKGSHYTMNYDLGYSFIEYIRSRWGFDSVIQLIRTNGSIRKTLGISNQEFQEDWYTFIYATYLR